MSLVSACSVPSPAAENDSSVHHLAAGEGTTTTSNGSTSLPKELDRADAVVLVYSNDDETGLKRVKEHWIPLVHAHRLQRRGKGKERERANLRASSSPLETLPIILVSNSTSIAQPIHSSGQQDSRGVHEQNQMAEILRLGETESPLSARHVVHRLARRVQEGLGVASH